MPEMTLIRETAQLPASGTASRQVRLRATRAQIAKRRWRGIAEDGREFGFDLEEPLVQGTCFLFVGPTHYVIEQDPETVLEVPVTTLEQAARIAWSLGNLHLGVQVLPNALRVVEDPAVLQLLAREAIAYRVVTTIFLPLSAAPHHHG